LGCDWIRYGIFKRRKKWTPASSGVEGIFCPLAYNGVNTWIVLGNNVASYSTDGQSWNPVPTIMTGYDVAYNGVDTWVAVGMGSDYLSCIMYSKDNGKIGYKEQIIFRLVGQRIYGYVCSV
jgi:hypothetical protein